MPSVGHLVFNTSEAHPLCLVGSTPTSSTIFPLISTPSDGFANYPPFPDTQWCGSIEAIHRGTGLFCQHIQVDYSQVLIAVADMIKAEYQSRHFRDAISTSILS